MVRKIFVAGKTEKPMKSEPAINLPEARLTALAGMYKNERDGSTFQLSVKNNKLVPDNDLSLTTVSENIFKPDNFLFDIKGTRGLYIPFSPRDTIPFTKVNPASLSQKDFSAYEGEYFSEETNSTLSIGENKGVLVVHLKPKEDFPLLPTYADAFKITGLDCDVQFTRSSAGKILLMKMSVSRTRNVEFKKGE